MRDHGTVPIVLAAIIIVTAAIAMTVALPQLAQAQTYTVLYNLTSGYGPGYPDQGILLNNGNLYGTLYLSGVNAVCCGDVFELTDTSSGWNFLALYNFTGSPDGWGPTAITFGPDGNIYGTTNGPFPAAVNIPGECGWSGCGAVFRLQPPSRKLQGWTETTLFTFTSSNGAYPGGDMVVDSLGNIYGAAGDLEFNTAGVVYELSPSGGGWTEMVLNQFSGPNGAGPTGVIMDRNGNLDGTTRYGGGGYDNCTSGCGTVFQLVPSSTGWTENVLYQFQNNGDGGQPAYGLTLDRAGNLYGTTTGAFSAAGTVFELSPGQGGWTLTTLYTFPAGCIPVSDLTMDPAGNLYGYASGCGDSAFELTPGNNSWAFTTLHEFDCNTGCGPSGKMAIDASGNLYGIATAGGTLNLGVVFEITPQQRRR